MLNGLVCVLVMCKLEEAGFPRVWSYLLGKKTFVEMGAACKRQEKRGRGENWSEGYGTQHTVRFCVWLLSKGVGNAGSMGIFPWCMNIGAEEAKI